MTKIHITYTWKIKTNTERRHSFNSGLKRNTFSGIEYSSFRCLHNVLCMLRADYQHCINVLRFSYNVSTHYHHQLPDASPTAIKFSDVFRSSGQAVILPGQTSTVKPATEMWLAYLHKISEPDDWHWHLACQTLYDDAEFSRHRFEI